MSKKNKHGRIDESGNRYGRLIVVKLSGRKHKKAVWLCRCDCGNTTEVVGSNLRSGHTKSCGCLSQDTRPAPINMTGQRSGRLTAVRQYDTTDNREATWLCLCDCGNEVIVNGRNLRTGNSKSCGCLQKELTAKRNTENAGINHPKYIDGDYCGWSKKEQRDFHEKIRKRDKYICQKCGKTQEQELIDKSQKLSVHHKDGDHFNNVDDNAEALCQSCHMKKERKGQVT